MSMTPDIAKLVVNLRDLALDTERNADARLVREAADALTRLSALVEEYERSMKHAAFVLDTFRGDSGNTGRLVYLMDKALASQESSAGVSPPASAIAEETK